jgi:hypothetical protein
MSKDKISDYSTTANSNTDIGGINVDEGCAPSGINDAIRTLMAQLKTWQSGGQDVYIHPAGTASAPSVTANGDTNTGIFFPAADTVAVTTGGSERARVDSSGNLGLGVTPSAWSSTDSRALQLRNANSSQSGNIHSINDSVGLSQNSYYASGWKYYGTGASSLYWQESGSHKWGYAASGTAGNAITFTQAMTLDASGNLGVGTTSIASGGAGTVNVNFHTPSANSVYLKLSNTSTGNTTSDGFDLAVDSSGNNYFINRENAASIFYTNATERARIDSSGNLLVGTTSSPEAYTTKIAAKGNISGAAIYANNTSAGADSAFLAKVNTTSCYLAYFAYGSSNVGTISTNGSTTSYNTTSDYRLKENVAPMTGALSVVSQLKPCTYTWKSDGSAGQGFIAHELQQVVPDAVHGEKDGAKEDGTPIYQGIDTSFLVATLTAAIQEQQAIITSLTARIEALEQA